MENLTEIASRRLASIESNSRVNTSTSIELPEAIDKLNIGNDYWQLAKGNRYKKLIREGHLADLLQLAEISAEKDNPAHWFARACSVKQWERTLDFLSKLREVVKNAAEVAKRLMTGIEHSRTIYAACWHARGNVLRHAITAEEIGKDRFKFFCWLVWEGPRRQTVKA